jgi:predicted nucleic acid-binding Zn ribbon protein
MGEYTIAQALQKMLRDSNWKYSYWQNNISYFWEKITSPIIAKHTKSIRLIQNKLIIQTDSGPLKAELNSSKQIVMQRINEQLGEQVVTEVIIT